MSTPKPVSPDFAAMARDYAERCGFKMKNPGYRMVHEDDLTKAFIAFAKDIRALASDPVAGDQVAWAADLIKSQEPLGSDFERVLSENLWDLYARSPDAAPAPGLAAREVEQAKEALYLALRNYHRGGNVGDNCVAIGALPLDLSAVYLAVDAALSAPRPAQAKGPTE